MSDVFFFLFSAQITDKVLPLAAQNTESSTVIIVIKVKVFTEKCNVITVQHPRLVSMQRWRA